MPALTLVSGSTWLPAFGRELATFWVCDVRQYICLGWSKVGPPLRCLVVRVRVLTIPPGHVEGVSCPAIIRYTVACSCFKDRLGRICTRSHHRVSSSSDCRRHPAHHDHLDQAEKPRCYSSNPTRTVHKSVAVGCALPRWYISLRFDLWQYPSNASSHAGTIYFM